MEQKFGVSKAFRSSPAIVPKKRSLLIIPMWIEIYILLQFLNILKNFETDNNRVILKNMAFISIDSIHCIAVKDNQTKTHKLLTLKANIVTCTIR